ncbi:MAG: cytochrome d ubiquinol oxidase subunit II [Phycisphaeraceae bacterium]|nr:cytochrome d ubiquinol oxidase subunit II [Phycisphaeraceae bacterium]
MDLNVLWFILLCVLLGGYAVLDGFDWGVGILHPLASTDNDKRIFINAIGPLWDGNEVWLVTFGGAMFAVFPEVYASVFSGFYTALMLLLFALIFRAVSIEFRSKMTSTRWRAFWDWSFCISSLLAAVLFGVAIGNAILGVPLTPRGIYEGGLLGLLGFYQVLVGLLTVAMFVMHGAIYLYLKTEPPLQDKVHHWIWHGYGTFVVLYLLTTIVTLMHVPSATKNFEDKPWLWIFVGLAIASIGNVPRSVYLKKPGQAFISSSLVILSLVGLFGAAIFPNLLISSPTPQNSLTIYSGASSDLTLKIAALIAAIGMPFVLGYTAVIYWSFRGKVRITEHSY